jgi:hypothetical protein
MELKKLDVTIYLAYDLENCRAVVNTVMKSSDSIKGGQLSDC